MKHTPLHRKGRGEVSKIKARIQSLLRSIVIKRDGGCVLRTYPEAGECGGYRNDGELILQAEHLVSRTRNISFGDTRNCIALCLKHHGFWKPQNSRLYWELVERVIGEKRWAWIKRVEKDTKTYSMGSYEWSKVELALREELKKYA